MTTREGFSPNGAGRNFYYLAFIKETDIEEEKKRSSFSDLVVEEIENVRLDYCLFGNSVISIFNRSNKYESSIVIIW